MAAVFSELRNFPNCALRSTASHITVNTIVAHTHTHKKVKVMSIALSEEAVFIVRVGGAESSKYA